MTQKMTKMEPGYSQQHFKKKWKNLKSKSISPVIKDEADVKMAFPRTYSKEDSEQNCLSNSIRPEIGLKHSTERSAFQRVSPKGNTQLDVYTHII